MENRSLKIAFITSKFPVPSETFISRKVDSLTAAGHSVTVFCSRFDRRTTGAKKYRNIVRELPNGKNPATLFSIPADFLKVLFLRPSYLPRLPRPPRKFVQRLALAARLVPFPWDIIHFHYLKNADMLRGLFPPSRNIPMVAGIYGYDVSVLPYRPGGMSRTVERAETPSGVIYSSLHLRSLLHEITEMTVPEIVIPPEIPMEKFSFRLRERCESPCRILSVGRLHGAKGYQFALATIRRLLERGVPCRYRIVGDGPAREELEYSIRTLRLQDHVTLLGWRTEEEVASEMENADLFFLPSIKEEFGIVLLEAQASGLPIVATRVGGTAEAVAENQTAILVPDRDPHAAADALIQLINDKELYARMNEAGRKFAAQFEMPLIAERLIAFYRTMIDKTDHRSASEESKA